MTRLLGAGALLFVLVWAEYLAPAAFPLVVAVILVVLPSVNWTTAWLLARRSNVAPDVLALRTAANAAILLALASSAAAGLGLYAILRSLNVVPPAPQVFLVGLAFALIILSAPAIDWLLVFRPWRDG